MKIKSFIAFAGFLLFLFSFSTAQRQAFVVHEDRVHPNMLEKYEAASKNLTKHMAKHQLKGADFLAVSTDDFRYMFVSPIENMADLDKDVFASMNKAMGKEAAAEMWSQYDGCYDEHGDYVIYLNNDLSYSPGGINTNPEGQYYRVFDYWYAEGENYNKLLDVAKDVKKLYTAKNIKSNYRIYQSGFGQMGPYIMVVSEAKDPIDWHTRSAAEDKILGEEMNDLVRRAFSVALKYERKTGWIRPDLSYSSN